MKQLIPAQNGEDDSKRISLPKKLERILLAAVANRSFDEEGYADIRKQLENSSPVLVGSGASKSSMISQLTTEAKLLESYSDYPLQWGILIYLQVEMLNFEKECPYSETNKEGNNKEESSEQTTENESEASGNDADDEDDGGTEKGKQMAANLSLFSFVPEIKNFYFEKCLKVQTVKTLHESANGAKVRTSESILFVKIHLKSVIEAIGIRSILTSLIARMEKYKTLCYVVKMLGTFAVVPLFLIIFIVVPIFRFIKNPFKIFHKMFEWFGEQAGLDEPLLEE